MYDVCEVLISCRNRLLNQWMYISQSVIHGHSIIRPMAVRLPSQLQRQHCHFPLVSTYFQSRCVHGAEFSFWYHTTLLVIYHRHSCNTLMCATFVPRALVTWLIKHSMSFFSIWVSTAFYFILVSLYVTSCFHHFFFQSISATCHAALMLTAWCPFVCLSVTLVDCDNIEQQKVEMGIWQDRSVSWLPAGRSQTRL